MKKIKTILVILLFASINSVCAQELSVSESSGVKIEQLPEYVIITSENTKLLGGSGISIDYKKSEYKQVLEQLELLLQNRKKLQIRNQTDLLNAMSKLGFEYVDAYQATASGAEGGDKEFSINDSKFRVNMVFRKKIEYRK
ncbi:hypothetical protein [Marinifilum caeruleilacunae]|uniref:DUF541 domain-containing protein n=1 Tax=Marinifilum caeruleilacunae TaxID=2499076 RepID=A0ABX1WVM1_9BACT|nr:hypothetical protein [Marinifilum caeruleilacunae]NOU60132.1 hypothetical protein [Marinifilum caeruleilacunae]